MLDDYKPLNIPHKLSVVRERIAGYFYSHSMDGDLRLERASSHHTSKAKIRAHGGKVTQSVISQEAEMAQPGLRTCVQSLKVIQ